MDKNIFAILDNYWEAFFKTLGFTRLQWINDKDLYAIFQ